MALENFASVRVGVLALQGSFREHITLMQRVSGVEAIEVRTKEELEAVSGLIIPGGESTTMANIATRWGLIPELKRFAESGKPIWGTCAGMIFLAERAEGMASCGQALLGGLDIKVSRNFFGAQINSFEAKLAAPECLKLYGSDETFRAVFIRAPAVLEVGPGVETLATYELTEEEVSVSGGKTSVIIAVRKGHLLATAFHPELTNDARWHALFADMVRSSTSGSGSASATPTPAKHTELGRKPNDPLNMPVYGKEFMKVEI